VRNTLKCLGIIACIPVLSCSGGKKQENSQQMVKIGDRTWTVELALTEEEKRKGLQGRSDLPEDRGMLFVYSTPQICRFWMKGCSYPLDIIFIGQDMRIINTREMEVEDGEGDLERYTSELPALYVLEVKGGSVAKAGISAGDIVEFRNIRTSPGK